MLGYVADILDEIIYIQNMLEYWDGTKQEKISQHSGH